MGAGTDPLTGRRHYLRETIQAGPSAQAEADKAMRRLATEVDERRNPRTSATVNQLLDRHFELAELEATPIPIRGPGNPNRTTNGSRGDHTQSTEPPARALPPSWVRVALWRTIEQCLA